MEPVTIIVSALVTAIANLAEPVVKDAYEGVKALIKQKFTGNAQIEGAMDGLETKPDIWEKPLESALSDAEAGKDSEIMAAVQRLQEALGGAGGSAGISVTGSQSGQDNTQVNVGQANNSTITGSIQK